MKATGKEFFREIKKSAGRFFSILFIVALGVAFFSGIRASEPDMRITGDAYYDSENLMDIKAISTLGVTADDVKAFEELDSIEMAKGAYSADFLTNVEDDQFALHVMSIVDGINQIELEDGRLPKKVGECISDAEMGYKVGDKIPLISGKDDKVTDTLKVDELEVVGVGSTPLYISFSRGSTTIGTGSLEGFVFVPEETFDMDVFTECYMMVKGAKEEISYTDEYVDLIDAAMEDVESISEGRAVIRRRELIDDATKELDKAKVDLEEGRKKAEKEIADAEKLIADGQKQLEDAKQKIADGKAQIESGRQTLIDKQKELDDGKAKYEAGLKELEEGRAQYEAGKAEFEANRPAAEEQIRQGEESLRQGEEAIRPIRTLMEGFASEKVRIQRRLEELAEDESEDAVRRRELLRLEMSVIDYSTNYIEQNYAYSENIQKLEDARNQLEDAKKQLADAERQLADTEALLNASAKELEAVPAQLADGQRQIDDGWKQLADSESKLSAGASEIAANEGKLQDAKRELEEGRTKAAKELADGEEKIAEAEEEIKDIPEATWYIYDRSTLPEYTGYGENADRMKAIGKVFPIIFFLVAALIALTSMTRMVEEQRVQIGTMKALGYSRTAIAKKYLGYALIATVAGSILGFLVGEKILPYVIIYAYGIMYHHMPEILTPYIASYAIQASVAAVFCTLFATWASCAKELRAQPAVLMRPPAPKVGKRVFLELIPFVWKRLNFTWKSTVRNLLRYKKRFFMTVFGIAGCMGMMILGYGIRDSVYEIAGTQYDTIQLYDGQIILQDDLTDDDWDELEKFLDEDKDIVDHMNVYMKNLVLKKGKTERQAYIAVIGDVDRIGDYVDFHDRKTKEKYVLSDNGVIVSEKTAKLLKVGIGDTIAIKDEENGDKEVVIENICENYMGHYMYMTPEYYEKVFGEEVEYNSIMFSMNDSFDKDMMEKAGKAIVDQDQVLSMSYLHDIETSLNNMLSSLNLVIIVLIISAGMLAFVVLYNLNTINITERQRELATLKVLGFYDGEVASYVFRENIILTFVGALGGIVLGKLLHAFIIQTVEVDAAMFGRDIYWPSFVYSFLFTVAFSLIINGIMYFKLKKISMVESLKSVE